MFLRPVNEGGVQFVEIQRLVNEAVKFIDCRCVLDLVHDNLQNVIAKSVRSQFLVKSRVDDLFESGHNCLKFVGVRDNLGNDC